MILEWGTTNFAWIFVCRVKVQKFQFSFTMYYKNQIPKNFPTGHAPLSPKCAYWSHPQKNVFENFDSLTKLFDFSLNPTLASDWFFNVGSTYFLYECALTKGSVTVPFFPCKNWKFDNSPHVVVCFLVEFPLAWKISGDANGVRHLWLFFPLIFQTPIFSFDFFFVNLLRTFFWSNYSE